MITISLSLSLSLSVSLSLPLLTGESKAGGDARHGGGDEMVQVSVGRGRQFQRPEADVVERFVVDDVGFVGVFDELMDGERGVVRLHHDVRHFGRRHDGEGVHDSVGIFLADFGDEQRAHAGSRATAQRVVELEPLKTVAALRFLAHDVEDGIDQFGTFRVMTLGPVVTGARLSENEIIWPKQLAKRSGADRVHRARLQVNQNNAGNVFSTWVETWRLIIFCKTEFRENINSPNANLPVASL